MIEERNGSGWRDRLKPLLNLLPEKMRGGAPVVPVIRLSGTIGTVTPLRPGLSLSGVSKLLDRGFGTSGAKAVAIVINSPGGSPVQSHQIYLRIRQLAAEKKLPVFAFVEDVAASGGYMIACAADEIWCDPSSILGSIGVIGGTFGFVEAIRKLGIERRVYTAGQRKATLDPFLPENPEDVARLKEIQREIHATFIDLVKSSRGARLKAGDDYLFTGEYWAGSRSAELGLADGIGDLRGTLRARFGDKVRMPVIAAPGGLLSGLLGRRSAAIGLDAGVAALPEAALATLEQRALWARYGL